MRPIIQLMVCIFALSLSSAVGAAERYKTENGITFFHTGIEDAKKVIFNVYWPHSWPYQDGNNPTAPLVGTQLMLQGGAGEMYPLDILQKFNELNSEGQLAAARYGIVGTLSLGKNNITEAAELVAEILGKPTLDANWMQRIISNSRKEREVKNIKFETQGWNAIRYLDLGTQPYRAFIAGDDVTNFDTLTQKDVEKWHRQTFQKTGMIVSVAGPITVTQASSAIDLMASKMPVGTSMSLPAIKLRKTTNRIWLHIPEAKKAVMGYSGRIPANSEGHEVEDLIAINLFNGGQSSVLFKALRTELRATYGFLAGMSTYDRNTKFVWFSGEVEPKMVSKVDLVIRETYSKFLSETPNESHFNALQDNIANALARNQKLAPIAANMALNNALDGFNVGRLDNVVEDVRAIKLKDVLNHLTKSYPKNDELVQFVVSPDLPENADFCVIAKPVEALNCK